MRKIEYIIIAAVFALLAWAVVAPAEASEPIVSVTIEPKYGQGTDVLEFTNDDVARIGLGKDGRFYFDDTATDVVFTKSYNKGYKDGDAAIVNWIIDQTGMKPSKLINSHIPSLKTTINVIWMQLQLEKNKLHCLKTVGYVTSVCEGTESPDADGWMGTSYDYTN